jgi:hypothetical protein
MHYDNEINIQCLLRNVACIEIEIFGFVHTLNDYDLDDVPWTTAMDNEKW